MNRQGDLADEWMGMLDVESGKIERKPGLSYQTAGLQLLSRQACTGFEMHADLPPGASWDFVLRAPLVITGPSLTVGTVGTVEGRREVVLPADADLAKLRSSLIGLGFIAEEAAKSAGEIGFGLQIDYFGMAHLLGQNAAVNDKGQMLPEDLLWLSEALWNLVKPQK